VRVFVERLSTDRKNKSLFRVATPAAHFPAPPPATTFPAALFAVSGVPRALMARFANIEHVILRTDGVLLQSLDAWPHGDWANQAIIDTYRSKLLRGLALGMFIRQVEGEPC